MKLTSSGMSRINSPRTSEQRAPEFDMSELETLFSATVPDSGRRNGGGKSGNAAGAKADKVHLCSVLALDDSTLDIDQIENLIKFCPTKEEMELLKNYKGEKENLGKCEQASGV
ncbi:formin-like protein 17 [Ipomoea triloba]|uniref:formin-like protein 17 n=1 Tax=Ipomoea triloba TaxID=35885 RepID=UPI00125E9D6A|nr:formin-like protein 17 [Ipomoea triloba]